MNTRKANETTACYQYRNFLKNNSCLLFKSADCSTSLKNLSAKLRVNCREEGRVNAERDEMERIQSEVLLREDGYAYVNSWR